MRIVLLVALGLLTSLLGAAAGETVRVENASRPTGCAEEDNIYVKLVGAGIARFTIDASHPAYLGALATDSMAANFSNCDQSHDRSYAFAPKDLTLYEDGNYRLLGHTFNRFWRPESVDFRVGGTVTRGLHLVQLIRKTAARSIEILVIYPSDGYWRIKPLPPPQFAETGYGSSFLIGPVEEEGRPFVRIEAIDFDPAKLTFRLHFRQGTGSVRVREASRARTRLEVSAPPSSRPSIFAALRSMHVSPDNADTAEITLDQGRPQPILDFAAGDAAEITFARSVPSRHNASAPDLRFGDFGR